ncbi:MAG: cadmium-translocating P-type ATPase [Clostridia bacterium]|nr:cadmium-translocating P-type ATPase [Clostridia bacterium]
MKQIFQIGGMTCAACQAHVQKAVEKLDGVTNVNVRLLDHAMSCEMDPQKCSVEDIEKAVSAAGYSASPEGPVPGGSPEKRKEEKENKGLVRLITAGAFLLLLMYVSMGHMMWSFPLPKVFSMHENPMGFALIQFLLTLPVVFLYRDYFRSGFKKLFRGTANMDTLIAIGSSASLLYGIFCLFMISLGHTEYHMYLYFESASMILVFVSVGKYLENRATKKTADAVRKLLDLAPKTARILDDSGVERTVPASDVRVGDRVVIRQGDSIPVDGTLSEGSVSVNQANITGESLPIFRSVGQNVFSATVVTSGYAVIRADKVGEDTTISEIVRLVDEAAHSKAPISRLADRISSVFVPVILILSLLTFIGNILFIHLGTPEYVGNTFETALNFAITVIVIACPCALGLATPVSVMAGTGKAAECGLLVKNATVLETMGKVRVVVMDKTGTLTKGEPEVIDHDLEDPELIDVIDAIEAMSSHPLADAVRRFCKGRVTKEITVSDYTELEGKGLASNYCGHEYRIGNARLANDSDERVREIEKQYSSEGKTVLFVFKDGQLAGFLTVRDEIKEGSRETVDELHQLGIKVMMLTGDNPETAHAIGREIGVDEIFAGLLPSEKQDIIKKIQKETGMTVAMVGDGVNDAPALMSADVGMAVRTGTDIAMESSDVVLLSGSLSDIPNAVRLSRRIVRTIKTGLFWAFFYNLICVFLATGVLYYVTGGAFRIQPMHGAIAMSLSSVSVVLNALTINFFSPKKKKQGTESSDQTTFEERENKNMKTVEIGVNGMMCMHCVAHVEEACKKVENVVDAKASLDTKSVVVTYENTLDTEAVKAKIVEAGYEIRA